MTISSPSTPSAPARPASVVGILALGVVAAAQSGNLVRLGGDLSPVAIAGWRLLLASAFLALLSGRSMARLGSLSLKSWGLLALGGVALAVHLLGWISGVQHTTVANAAIVFAVNPVFTALAEWAIFRERPSPRLVASVGLGLAGVLVMGWHDLGMDPVRLRGDLYVLGCSVAFSAYFLVGRRLRRELEATTYASALYAAACLPCFLAFPFLDLPFFQWSSQAWWCFGLMALVPTVLGHTSLNHALKYLGAGRVSAATLAEPLIAGVVAWLAWGEPLTGITLVGYVLITLSVVFLVMEPGGGSGSRSA